MPITLKLLALLRGAKPSYKLLYSGWSFFKMYPMNTVLACWLACLLAGWLGLKASAYCELVYTICRACWAWFWYSSDRWCRIVLFSSLPWKYVWAIIFIALSFVRAFGAMRLVLNYHVSDAWKLYLCGVILMSNKIPHNNLSNAKLIWHTKVHAHCQ